jgi:hypothetical protein
VLLNLASGSKLIDPFLIQLVLASMVLSMLLAPFVIANSDKIVMKMASNEWMLQSLQLTQIASRTMAAQKHVIIAGFGRSGQSLATLLSEEKLPWYALDLDPERVQEARRRRQRLLRRLFAAGSPDRGRYQPRQRAGDHLCRHPPGAQGAAPGARAGAQAAGDRARPRRHRTRCPEAGRRHRGGAGGAGIEPDAGLARAGGDGGAAAPRGAPGAGRARRALRLAARLLPRRRRRQGRPGAQLRAPALGGAERGCRRGRALHRRPGTG